MIPILPLALLAGAAYFVWSRSQKKPAVAASSGCNVVLTKSQMKSQIVQEALADWLGEWMLKPSATVKPARSGAIALMQIVAPQCTWTPTTNATIKRADGTTQTWAQMMSIIGTSTMGELANSGVVLPTLILGEDPDAT